MARLRPRPPSCGKKNRGTIAAAAPGAIAAAAPGARAAAAGGAPGVPGRGAEGTPDATVAPDTGAGAAAAASASVGEAGFSPLSPASKEKCLGDSAREGERGGDDRIAAGTEGDGDSAPERE